MSADPLHSRLLALTAEVGGPLLGIDTSGTRASVCRVGWRDGHVDEVELPAGAMPSESLVQTLAAAAAAAGLELSRLRAIVIGLGPGSFTGLRVGLATVKGMALGADVPLYGVSSLGMLAATHGPGAVAPVVDARRDEIFGALYEVDDEGGVSAVIDDAAWVPDAFAARLAEVRTGRVRLVGSGATACMPREAPAETDLVPTASLRVAHGLMHAAQRIRDQRSDSLDSLAPRYMKASEAERGLASS